MPCPRRFIPAGALLLAVCLSAPQPAVADPGAQGADASPAPLPAPATLARDADGPVLRRRFSGGVVALQRRQFGVARRSLDQVARESQFPERAAAAAALSRYAARLQALGLTNAPPDDPSAGRTEFIVSSTLGAAYAGAVVLDLIDNDDVRVGAGVMLLSTGLGLAGSIYGSRGLRITEATGEAYASGMVWGAATGLLLTLGADVETSESMQLATLAGGFAGGALAFALSDHLDPTRGQVNFVGTGAILGVATSALTLVVVQPDNVQSTTVAWTVLGGLQVGTLAAAALLPEIDWSVSRTRLVTLGAAVGVLTGWGVMMLVSGDDSLEPRAVGGMALAGLWGGFGLAAWLTEDMKPDPRYTAPRVTGALAPTVLATARGRAAPGLAWSGRF